MIEDDGGYGKLVSVCLVLGGLSIVVSAIEKAIPVLEPRSAPRVDSAPREPAKPVATSSAPAPSKEPRVTVRTEEPAPPPRTEAAPRTEDPRRELAAAERARSEPPSEPATEPTPTPPTPPPPPQAAPPTPAPPAEPSPASHAGVSDAPEVAPQVGSPLDDPSPSAAPKAEKLRPGEQVERYEDGSIKARWMTNSKGERSGSYVELHRNGKVKKKATYKADRLEGTLTEADESGKVVRRESYRHGQLHGDVIATDTSGKVVVHETWFEGKLVYTKSLDQIERTLAEIAAAPIEGPQGASKLPDFEPFSATAQIKATRRLRAYRYLCDVPYDVTISRPEGELCTAACRLLEIIGRLDHHPERPPGVPDSLYVPACEGLANGNLHTYSNRTGETLLMGGVDIWVWDSDKHNIGQVGHRRWSLNPRMKEVAWGVKGNFTVMYSHDEGHADAHARDFVAYPSRGLFPISYLVKDSAWSCSFDMDRYRIADDAKVEVRPADERLRKGEPVVLHDVAVNKEGFGDSVAMIFRPEVKVAAGARYWVTITGVTDQDGKPVPVEYLVEFCRG